MKEITIIKTIGAIHTNADKSHFTVNGCAFNVESLYRNRDIEKNIVEMEIHHIHPGTDTNVELDLISGFILITQGRNECVIRDSLYSSNDHNLLWNEQYKKWKLYFNPKKDKCVLLGFCR